MKKLPSIGFLALWLMCPVAASAQTSLQEMESDNNPIAAVPTDPAYVIQSSYKKVNDGITISSWLSRVGAREALAAYQTGASHVWSDQGSLAQAEVVNDVSPVPGCRGVHVLIQPAASMANENPAPADFVIFLRRNATGGALVCALQTPDGKVLLKNK